MKLHTYVITAGFGSLRIFLQRDCHIARAYHIILLMETKRINGKGYFVMMFILRLDLETESMQNRRDLPCVPGKSNNNGFIWGCTYITSM